MPVPPLVRLDTVNEFTNSVKGVTATPEVVPAAESRIAESFGVLLRVSPVARLVDVPPVTVTRTEPLVGELKGTLKFPALSVVAVPSTAPSVPSALTAVTVTVAPLMVPFEAVPEIVTADGATLKFTELEVPPPGLGLTTVREYVPAASVEVGKVAVNCVEETKVVETFEPAKLITEGATKLLPVTVTGVFEPTVAELGETEVTAGTG